MKDIIHPYLQWSIKKGDHIPVWDHHCLSNTMCILPTTPQQLEWPYITIADLMVTHQNQWNMELINGFFYNNTARSISNTPLLALELHDVPTWELEKDGVYTDRSVYKGIMNHDVLALQHRVSENWNCVWKLKLPPKVKNFLWSAYQNCLSARVLLQSKVFKCPD